MLLLKAILKVISNTWNYEIIHPQIITKSLVLSIFTAFFTHSLFGFYKHPKLVLIEVVLG